MVLFLYDQSMEDHVGHFCLNRLMTRGGKRDIYWLLRAT